MKTLSKKFSDYFDKVYVINLVNRPERKKFIIDEFKKVGIYDDLMKEGKLEFVEAIRLPITQKAMDCMYMSGDVDFRYGDNGQRVGQFMCASEHYRVIKKSVLKNYQRIMVFEDDVCFLKDFSYIMKAIDEAPDDFKILHFEGFYWPLSDEDRNSHLDSMTKTVEEGHWVPFEQLRLWCASALIYSREGMEEYCEWQERKFIGPDHPTFWITDKCYAYSYPLIIQECKQEFKSDIIDYSSDIENINVYLTYYDYNNYYHSRDFENEE